MHGEMSVVNEAKSTILSAYYSLLAALAIGATFRRIVGLQQLRAPERRLEGVGLQHAEYSAESNGMEMTGRLV
jgi:hypothetical protein